VELKAQRLAGRHEEELAGVALGDGEDHLVAPRLVDLLRF
jgi:hypothetical protein